VDMRRGGCDAAFCMTVGGGTFGGGIFRFGGGAELIVDGTVCTGGGADIMGVITLGGGTLATFGTVTTMAWEPAIGIIVGGICDIGGRMLGGGILGGGIFGGCKLVLHAGGCTLHCCGFCMMCCCPFEGEDKLGMGIL
jgi:hypothetical protein